MNVSVSIYNCFITTAEHLPVADSASLICDKGYSSDVIQLMSCELQSQWFPLKSICIMISKIKLTSSTSVGLNHRVFTKVT